MDKEEKETLEALREWVRAEARHAVDDSVEDSQGYTGSDHSGGEEASRLFEVFSKKCFK